MTKRVIVNADDLGRTPGINAGIARAVDNGVVTSASLMVRWPAARNIARWSAERPQVSIGLHVDLAECEYENGQWRVVYCVVDPDDDAAVVAEVRAQLAQFTVLLGRPPTHLDSHQHVHRAEPVHTALTALAAELGVPVRSVTPSVTYEGGFYGQLRHGEPAPELVAVDALIERLAALSDGTTELSCHPGDPAGLWSAYTAERALEVETLCDPRVRAAVAEHDIELASFSGVVPNR